MKAIVKIAPADGHAGTEIREVPRPVPGEGEVLIRVAAAAICGTDKHIYHWDPSIRDRFDTPRIYGHEFCGFIEDVGPGVGRQDLTPGDYVSAEMHVVCGVCPQCRTGNGHICQKTKIYGLHGDGAFAEFVKVPASNVIRLDARYVPIEVGAFLDALGNAVHTTQVVDLAGKSVAITGFGPIGAMAAAIAEHCGASTVIVTDISDHSLETARRWAAARNFSNLHVFNVATAGLDEIRGAVGDLTEGGVDVLLEMSGAASAINLGLDMLRPGGFMSILGLPAGRSMKIEDYSRNVVFKGITIQGIIGRRMYDTWQRMLALLRSGLDVRWVLQAEYDSLDGFHEGIAKFDRHEALKVVFYPAGKKSAVERLNSRQAVTA
jgi:threonine 3-dehydrogenase